MSKEENDIGTSLSELLSEYSISLRWPIQDNDIKDLLVLCAASIYQEKLDIAGYVMQILKTKVSICGDPFERLGAYMSEGLVARLNESGYSLYNRLKCREALAVEVLSTTQKLFEICPYVKFAYMAANGAIAEASRGEAKVHIFDFQIHQGIQWLSLMQAIANTPGGPPSIRISTVDDPTSPAYPVGGMQVVRQRLSHLAANLAIPFEFSTVPTKLCELQAHMIERRPGEALVMNFGLQLHRLPDESVFVSNPRDVLLRMAKSLNPKVLTLVEQEANTNTTPFLARFVETFDYFAAVFESIDLVAARDNKDRIYFEEQCLARQIVNIIACEGTERVERHELFGKWRARMIMAGFRPQPLSSRLNGIIKSLLESYNRGYMLKEEGEALLLGWQSRSLIAASAWI